MQREEQGRQQRHLTWVQHWSSRGGKCCWSTTTVKHRLPRRWASLPPTAKWHLRRWCGTQSTPPNCSKEALHKRSSIRTSSTCCRQIRNWEVLQQGCLSCKPRHLCSASDEETQKLFLECLKTDHWQLIVASMQRSKQACPPPYIAVLALEKVWNVSVAHAMQKKPGKIFRLSTRNSLLIWIDSVPIRSWRRYFWNFSSRSLFNLCMKSRDVSSCFSCW